MCFGTSIASSEFTICTLEVHFKTERPQTFPKRFRRSIPLGVFWGELTDLTAKATQAGKKIGALFHRNGASFLGIVFGIQGLSALSSINFNVFIQVLLKCKTTSHAKVEKGGVSDARMSGAYDQFWCQYQMKPPSSAQCPCPECCAVGQRCENARFCRVI